LLIAYLIASVLLAALMSNDMQQQSHWAHSSEVIGSLCILSLRHAGFVSGFTADV
jgi:hypothetical protein